MLRTTFDLTKRRNIIIYLRMSSDRQNPRSPDQQLQAIQEAIARHRMPWTIVKVYRDDAVSGRFEQRRPQYKQMFNDLKAGAVSADLLAVDTFERLTRADSAHAVRGRLRDLGVWVVTADSGFADPTTAAGKALAMVEEVRATEDGRIKAHNVVRGKKDTVRHGKWPGGPPPLGYRLKAIFVEHAHAQTFSHNTLEVDPETAWVVQRMFHLAVEVGWGTTRIAKALNADPNTPAILKPIHAGTVGNVLDREVYYGDLVWNKHCTGIIKDVRKLQPLPEDDWVRIENFCEPVVSRATWDAAHRQRKYRGERMRRTGRTNGSLTACGVSIKYLLAGLVLCGLCGRAMAPVSSPIYKTKSGDKRRYVKYACQACGGGACSNTVRVSEQWLREKVVGLIHRRVFGWSPDAEGPQALSAEAIQDSPAFQDLLGLVRSELETIQASQPDRTSALISERARLESQQQGWRQSLSNPQLLPNTRSGIERDHEAAGERILEITRQLASEQHTTMTITQAVTPARVAEALVQLADSLASGNVSAANVLLAQHIAGIYCHPDHVSIRTCKLGALADVLDIVVSLTPAREVSEASSQDPPGTGRRRARRNLGNAFEDEEEADAANEMAVDPGRFAGLGPEWFTEDIYPIPTKQSWAQKHAEAVFLRRQESHGSSNQLAQEFGVSRPTIQAAIKVYLEQHSDAVEVRPFRVRRPRIDLGAFAVEARRLYEDGVSKLALAKQFGVSEPTLVRALQLAYVAEGQVPTRNELQEPLVRRIRELFDGNMLIKDIAAQVGLSRVTTSLMLKQSFTREGATLPNLRRRRRECQRSEA